MTARKIVFGGGRQQGKQLAADELKEGLRAVRRTTEHRIDEVEDAARERDADAAYDDEWWREW